MALNLPDLTAKLRIDTGQLDRALDATERRLGTLGGQLTKVGLITSIGALVPQAVALTTALAPATAAIGALPAAVGVAGGAIGTLAVGVKGLGDAFKAVGEGDAEKLNEALKKLSPSARTFVVEVSKLGKEFGNLRREVQESLFAGLTGPVTTLARTSLPTLREGLNAVAASLSNIGESAANTLAGPLFQGALASIFESSRVALDRFAAVLPAFINGLGQLIKLGQPLTQRFFDFLNAATASAGAFLSSEEGAAKFLATLEKAGDTLSLTFDVLKNLGSIIGTIFQAGAIDGFLVNLEQMTAQFAAFLKTPEGQDALATLFQTLQELSAAVAEVLPVVAKAIIGVLGAFNSLPEPVRSAVLQFAAFGLILGPILAFAAKLAIGFKGLTTVFSKVGGPALKFFGKIEDKIVKVIPALAKPLPSLSKIGSSIVGVFSKIGPAFGRLAPILTKVPALFGPIGIAISVLITVITLVVQNFDKIKQAASAVASFFTGTVAPAITSVANTVTSFFGAVVAKVQSAFTGLIAVVNGPFQFIKGIVTTVLTELGSRVRGFVDFFTILFTAFILPVVQSVFNTVRDHITTVFDTIRNVVNTVLTFVGGLFTTYILQPAMFIFETVREFIERKFYEAQRTIDDILFTVKGYFEKYIRGPVTEVFNFVKTFVSTAFESVKNSVKEKIDSVVGFITGIRDRVVNGLGNLSGSLFQAGKDLIQGLLNGMNSILSSIGNFMASKLPAILQDPFKRALGIASPSKVFAEYGRNIGEGLQNGIAASIGGVTGVMGDLSAAVNGGFSANKLALQTSAADFSPSATATAQGAAGPTTTRSYSVNITAAAFSPQQLADESIAALRRLEWAQV